MKKCTNTDLVLCSQCGEQLQADAFYYSKKRGRDRYCKQCRRKRSRKNYAAQAAENYERPRHYQVITEIADPVLRHALIKNALRIVAESCERKRKRLIDLEAV